MTDSLLRTHWSATDPVGATAAVRAVLGAAEVACGTGRLAWEQVSLIDDGISVSSIRASGDHMRLHVRGASELLVVQLDRGSAALRTGGERLELRPHDLALVPISADAELRWSTAHLQLFSIAPAPIARLLGVPRSAIRLHAPRLDPCSPELAEYFRRIARLLTSEVFGTPEVYGRDIVRAHAVDTLTATVVELFELTNASEDDTDRDAGVVRRATADMRAHLIEPLTVPEVAEAAGVSVRGLQMAFRRQLGTSPLLHLRQLRLEGAREALVAEAMAGTTIADVARRFGYANSGRFSTHYRNEYGEPPSATLSRIRSGAVAPTDAPVSEADLIHAEPRYEDHGTPGPGTSDGATAARSVPDR